MLDDHELEVAVYDLIIDICEVLHQRGYESIPVAAVMRLVGVDSERASRHEGEFFYLDKEFETLLSQRKSKKPRGKKARRHNPDGATLH